MSLIEGVCPRCGRKLSCLGLPVHRAKCDTIPPPNELARIFMDDPNCSISGLVEEYASSIKFIDTHLDLGGVSAKLRRERGSDLHRSFVVNRKMEVSCPRCGASIRQVSFNNHKNKCDKLPVPAELARIFSDPKTTIASLVECYGLSRDFVRRHLRLAGVVVVEKPKDKKVKEEDVIEIEVFSGECPDCSGFIEANQTGPYCIHCTGMRKRKADKVKEGKVCFTA